MNLFRIIIYFVLFASIGMSQNRTIKDVFSQKILTEDFTEQNYSFPTITGSDGKYAIIMDSLGYYGLGSGNTEYPILIDWKNDLIDFELKIKLRLKNETESFVVQKLQGQKGQIIGFIMKYNPDKQEAIIFETNTVRQYRLSHLKNDKLRSLTDGWVFTENLKRNEVNEIIIKTRDSQYDFYINDKFTFTKNLRKLENVLSFGDFGFYIGPNTQVMIDYFHISTLKDYNGVNKLFNLSEEEAKELIKEKEDMKKKLEQEKTTATKELKEVIELLEQELKSSNQLIDSLQTQNERFEPFKGLIEENGNFMYTLTKDLKEQMEKNNILHEKNQLLMDSINFLIKKQDEFKLEYLRVLDSMMEKNDTINEN